MLFLGCIMYIILKHIVKINQALLSGKIKDNLIPHDMTPLETDRLVLWWDRQRQTVAEEAVAHHKRRKEAWLGYRASSSGLSQSVSCQMSHVTACWWRRMPAVSLCIFPDPASEHARRAERAGGWGARLRKTNPSSSPQSSSRSESLTALGDETQTPWAGGFLADWTNPTPIQHSLACHSHPTV